MDEKSKGFLKPSEVEQLMPQEEMLEYLPDENNFSIGIPKELSVNENRVPLVPEAVKQLVDSKHNVFIEDGSGAAANFTNENYAEAGATIVSSAEEIYKCDLVSKISPPLESEIEMLGRNKVLLSSLFLPNTKKEPYTMLMANKSIAIAYEFIQDRSGSLPVMKSISEIVGNTAVLLASQYLRSPEHGKGKSLGGFPGITPAQVVIIGSGTVAQSAARTVLGMGAAVKIFDNSIHKLRRIQSKLMNSIPTSTLNPKAIKHALQEADVVIAAKFTNLGITPCLITEDMVRSMEQGSVIIDVSIDQGGCFETSKITRHDNPIFDKYGVTHYCVPNIASCVPNTASHSLSNIIGPILESISRHGGIDRMLKHDNGLRKGVYIYKGALTNGQIGNLTGLPSRDIELLIAAFDL
ncbi:MAG: alanine dehydrogenase [Bacteroidales bacterium]|jgi:alanine dehydrogenase|nr:alanine dehydrogenase [Lentimicrobiaceae bacterium]MDG1136359.1 alanine dehydrogenase [Bacteroidales bacterium]MDG1901896.1 alanine dehydrogenase [Bacteroidales bacterium]MDG2081041.1 alanine dehydrogenase [Bacteroidales bacterium]|tara:strand:+ start:7493 stop:8719 length:1227 start_codon:yes stop_codon:yes gene_type:complete